MKLSLYRYACPVGIEIQASEIRLARLARGGKGKYRVDCADIGRLSSVKNGAVDWFALRELLGQMVRAWGLKGVPAVVSLPAGSVRMHRMPRPRDLPPYAIEAAVQGKLRQEMFGSVGSFCVDYAELTAGSSLEDEVYYVASRQELLAQYVECAASAGLQVKIVDVDVCARQRAICYQFDERMGPQHVSAILICSVDSMEWIVYDRQAILLHREFGVKEFESVEQLLERQLKNLTSHYPHYVIQQVILSGKIDKTSSSHLTASCGVNLIFRDALPWMQELVSRHHIADVDTYRLLTACGLSMRELPPWC